MTSPVLGSHQARRATRDVVFSDHNAAGISGEFQFTWWRGIHDTMNADNGNIVHKRCLCLQRYWFHNF
jgi:hypothetical protein